MAELRDVLRAGTVGDQQPGVGMVEVVEPDAAELSRLAPPGTPGTGGCRRRVVYRVHCRRQTQTAGWSTSAEGPSRASAACRSHAVSAWTLASRACRAKATAGRESRALRSGYPPTAPQRAHLGASTSPSESRSHCRWSWATS